MKKKDLLKIFVLVVVVGFSALFFLNRQNTVEKTRFLLDTIVDISVTAKNKNCTEKKLKTIVDSTFSLILKYEKKFSYFLKDSKLWEMNNSEKDNFSIDSDFYEMLKLSSEVYSETDSLYDISIGSLTELWDFDKVHIPSLDSIEFAQNNIGFHKIKFSENQLYKPKEIKINLGSVAKGFIIDKAITFLKDNKVESAIINAGGDIRILDYPKPLRVGIQNPRKQSEVIAVLTMQNSAVVTSGDYERYFEIDGQIYHHIVNPKTGFPAYNSISVTVIASSATIADAYSTALFLMEPDDAIELTNTIENIEAIIFYFEDDEIVNLKSNGLKEYLIKD
ncbi:MAG: FAD:protein FMN transferase [Armatimonadetes bacterium]|nr:FAD:protein FMN transferase [Armatimonadota bacterium]